MKAKIINKNAYLYSLWDGQLKVYEGDVHETWTPLGTSVTKMNTMACSKEPKTVYNSVVWLEERNDNLARACLIIYEEAEIAILQEQMEHHQNKIRILKGE